MNLTDSGNPVLLDAEPYLIFQGSDRVFKWFPVKIGHFDLIQSEKSNLLSMNIT